MSFIVRFGMYFSTCCCISDLQSDEAPGEINQELLGTSDIYRIPGRETQEYTAKLTIDYTDDNNAFGSREFIIINI